MKTPDICEKTFTSANIITARVGTTGLCGGDSGHGCRTVFELVDEASTSIKVQVLKNEGNGGVRIEFGGDCELETFVECLEWSAKILRDQMNRSKKNLI